jgi:hypothetical protein
MKTAILSVLSLFVFQVAICQSSGLDIKIKEFKSYDGSFKEFEIDSSGFSMADEDSLSAYVFIAIQPNYFKKYIKPEVANSFSLRLTVTVGKSLVKQFVTSFYLSIDPQGDARHHILFPFYKLVTDKKYQFSVELIKNKIVVAKEKVEITFYVPAC